MKIVQHVVGASMLICVLFVVPCVGSDKPERRELHTKPLALGGHSRIGAAWKQRQQELRRARIILGHLVALQGLAKEKGVMVGDDTPNDS